MLIDQLTLYEKKHYIEVRNNETNIFYTFDYDERSFKINMDFQHFHPYFEILILLAPEAEHLVEGRNYHLLTHDLVLLAPSVLHKSIYHKGDPSKRIIITFSLPHDHAAFIEDYNELLTPFYQKDPIFRFSDSHKALLFSKLNEIFTLSRSANFHEKPMNKFAIHTKFMDFLLTLYSLYPHNQYENIESNDHITQKVIEICSYINKNYHEELSLSSLSKQFFISSCYLSHRFKEITHFNITTYIHMTRIKNAEYKLITSDDKISDIAEQCGFTSFSQFNRIFQKFTQTSPRDFRKNGALKM